MVFVAFVDDEIDTQVLIVDAIHRIADNSGVAIAFGIVFLDDVFLVVLVVLLKVFRCLENPWAVVVVEILFHPIDSPHRMQGDHIGNSIHNQRSERIQRVEMAAFLGLFHRGQNLAIRKILISNQIDFLDFHLRAFVNIDDHIDITLAGGVGLLLNVDIHVVKSLVVVVILNDTGGFGQQVVGGNVAARKVDLVSDFVGLAFLDAIERELRNTRFFLDDDLQEDLVSHKVGDVDGHIFKHSLFPNLSYS